MRDRLAEQAGLVRSKGELGEQGPRNRAAYGGPEVPPDQPSPESVKLTESLVLLEFVADLYPNTHILPADPVQRARARFFVEAVSTKLVPAWMTLLKSGTPESSQAFLNAIDLPPQGFAIGEYSIADISVAPFVARAHVALGNEIGAYAVGEGKRNLEALHQPRFARFQKYWADLQARPSFQATFNKDYITEEYKQRFGNLRAKQ